MADIKNHGIKGVGDDVEYGKGGGRMIWSGKFASRENDGTTSARHEVGDVVAATDAVNFRFADAMEKGRQRKEACRLCTAGTLTSWTSSGSGVGKTLTSPTSATSHNDFDGVTAVVNDRILVTLGPATLHNGIYTMTTLADGAAQNAVITRALDADEDSNLAGLDEIARGIFTLVTEGTTCAGQIWAILGAGAITIDTTGFTFTHINFNDTNVRTATLNTSASQNLGALVPANARIRDILLEITTPYSSGGTIEIRDDGPTTYMATTENDAQDTTGVVFETKTNGFDVVGGTGQMQAIIGGAPGVGAATVSIHYTL